MTCDECGLHHLGPGVRQPPPRTYHSPRVVEQGEVTAYCVGSRPPRMEHPERGEEGERPRGLPSPREVDAYLRMKGWEMNGAWAVKGDYYSKVFDGVKEDVHVPKALTGKGYAVTFSMLVEALAKLERRTFGEIISDMRRVFCEQQGGKS